VDLNAINVHVVCHTCVSQPQSRVQCYRWMRASLMIFFLTGTEVMEVDLYRVWLDESRHEPLFH